MPTNNPIDSESEDRPLTRLLSRRSAALVGVTALATLGVGAVAVPAAFAQAAPTVTSVTPDTGPLAGGTAVTIDGTDFTTGATVDFGTALATDVDVVSATEITADTPATTTAGAVVVTVADTDGTSTTTGTAGANEFTYGPTITSISPTTGSEGTAVTITGTGFASDATVDFNGTSDTTDLDVVSSTEITVDAPAAPTDVTSVPVTVLDGTTPSNAETFTYTAPTAPTITAVTPAEGIIGTTTTPVEITGTGFTDASAVDFGTVAAASFDVVSATEITAVAPASTTAATVSVSVTTPAGTNSLASGFTYEAAPTVVPTVTAVAPASGTANGGQTVTLTGTNFIGATSVTFGAATADSTAVAPGTTLAKGDFAVLSSTEIEADSPPGTAGDTVDVTVSNSVGTSVTSTSAEYTYSSDAAPTVISVTPDTGPAAGGTAVTIVGTGFVTGSTVDFGTVAATDVVVNTDGDSITADSPADATTAGGNTVDVTVTTPGGISATSTADAFTYATAVTAPTVTAIGPTTGPAAGGTLIGIAGTGFVSGATVDFGTVAATDVTYVSPTAITAVSPAGTGTVNVTVTENGVTSPTSTADDFTYAAAVSTPTISVSSRTGRGDVTVSGTATSGTTVDLYHEAYGSTTYNLVQSQTSSGSYSFTSYITKSTYFYVETSGVKSATDRAHVDDTVGLTLTKGTKKFTARVTTDPAVDVDVTFDRITASGSVVKLKTVRITNSSGSLTKTLTTGVTGSIRVKAVVAGGDGSYGGTSATKSVTVKK